MELDCHNIEYTIGMPPLARIALAEDCEDFLLHRNIPLHSECRECIIQQALKEGYQLSKFDRVYIGPLT